MDVTQLFKILLNDYNYIESKDVLMLQLRNLYSKCFV